MLHPLYSKKEIIYKLAIPNTFIMKKTIIFIFLTFFILFTSLVNAQDCKPGYEWQRMSGVGCVQSDCNSIADAHYSYTKDCVCGSVGSINEKPNDPNKACHRDWEYTSCPGCLYACIHTDDMCPGEDIVVLVKDFEGSDNDNRNYDDYYDEIDNDDNETNFLEDFYNDIVDFEFVELDNFNDWMGATFFGEIEYEECSAYDNKGKIDCVINWTFDDYDANGCSPQEKIKTEIVDSKTKEIHTLCACKEGYKRVEGGCKFIPPKGIKLENKEQEQLELVYRTLKSNEYKVIELKVDGKIKRIAVMRRSNDQLVFGGSGVWKSSLQHLLEPTTWQKLKDITFFSGLNPINWFHTSYKDADKEHKWLIAKLTLDDYKKDIKKPTHFIQTMDTYIRWSMDKKVARDTLASYGIIAGGSNMMIGSITSYGTTFPVEAVNKLASELQIDDFAQGMSYYMRYRDKGKTPQELMNNPPDDMDLAISAGTASSLGNIMLIQKYEEGYQRYKAEKELKE